MDILPCYTDLPSAASGIKLYYYMASVSGRYNTCCDCLYGLGYPRQPFPRVTLGEIFFHSFVYNILSTVYMRWARQLGRARQLGEASCLASADRVALAGETTFSHVNSLARLPETRQQSLKCARIK